MNHLRFVDRWPSLSAFAADIGVTYGTAKAIRLRERRGLGVVPAAYWRLAVAGARRRGVRGVSLRALAQAAEHLADMKSDAAASDQRAA